MIMRKAMKMRMGTKTSILVILMLTILAPTSTMATTAVNNSGSLTFEATKEVGIEKAKLLTETYGATSLQYALIDDGEIVISGHAGKNDLNGNRPLTANTMYGIGSTSKMMLTAAVMKLVDEGKVELDLPVVNYIPDFKMKDDRYKQITPRMLLNHSSGLLGTSSLNTFLYDDNDSYAYDSLLEHLATQNLKADPGAFSVYCNDGFTLAEILIERVSGMSFTAFISKYLTEPLEMSHTKTPKNLVDSSKLAGIYSPAFNGQLPAENTNIIATGGIYSTAEDLVKFSQIFTGQVSDILTRESVEAMAQDEYKRGMWPEEADPSFVAYGLGWDSVRLFPFSEYGIKALTKGGDTLSYHSSLVVLPEYNMAAAVVSSGGQSLLDQLLANEILLSALQEKGIIHEQKPKKSHGVPIKAKMPQELSQHAGIYGGISSALMKVEINSHGELSVSMLTVPNNPIQTYSYTADGSFVNKEGTEKIKFIEEKNGHTYLWSSLYFIVPGLPQTAVSEYKAEKLEANILTKDIASVWEKREGEKYYLMNEKYSSMLYTNSAPTVTIDTIKDVPGYLLTNKIIGANQAVNQQQIPGMAGRDTMEIEFFKKNGVEYFTVAGGLYGHEELVKPLYPGKQSVTTIQADGHAKWFLVPTNAKEKIMTVKMPSNGSFAVYDQAGNCVNYTVVSGINEVLLPENGRVVFAGEVDAKFEISLKK
ncbi:serine hydrolase domain-containing protein [Lysinibacillus fusiformis]|uniref:serine hydrolase domain-containing protein n=1 Tax=Lysinibacillus fusiformis TaxID=28031 RepID=UPI000891AFD2|nr:serine hydrolase domain-containing protein [Lysinibacillus fusiformis]SCX56909.1 CubicO group peptidase, beta-lactamase class C family [Lysinibacillus fusiformis]SDB34027.1 CubicO group peptidase, beta-lactamase class C family [Lysinibacillus fusiformis]SFI34323.1 CubicO group peptidase, beta-lactamase class C family [Lysinibacillus fusiformis]SFS92682.1 CubicO group peptidase, beta-lactamase class C family [Lysinibacillus fusiformis]